MIQSYCRFGCKDSSEDATRQEKWRVSEITMAPPSFYSGNSRLREKSLEPVQNTKSEFNLMERIHAGVKQLSIE